jgi:hypothetical protein
MFGRACLRREWLRIGPDLGQFAVDAFCAGAYLPIRFVSYLRAATRGEMME